MDCIRNSIRSSIVIPTLFYGIVRIQPLQAHPTLENWKSVPVLDYSPRRTSPACTLWERPVPASSDPSRIDDLFDVASDLSAEDRAAFLNRECSGDSGLRAEVERLLFHHDRAGLLDSTLPEGITASNGGRESTGTETALAEGTLLSGRFRIGQLLGSGGMGSVYEAEDGISGRPVALKTIRGDLVTDSRSIARLRKELLLARDISHPNVCKVFEYWDIEDD